MLVARVARAAALSATLLLAREVHAEETAPSPYVEALQIEGNTRTRASTVAELLPRPLPTVMTDEELQEVERRVRNLEIFDDVHVERRGSLLHVRVREKWTLIPAVELSTGETVEDLRLVLGATEYNLLGSGDQLAVRGFRAERGWGGGVTFREHSFRRRQWSLQVELNASTAEYRYESGTSWGAFRSYGEVTFTSPPFLSEIVNVRVGAFGSYESTHDRVLADVPAQAEGGGTILGLYVNRYTFHDLTPSGVKGEIFAGTGFFAAGTPVLQPRHYVEGYVIGAKPLGERTVLAARVSFATVSRGNPNYSYLVGSVDGVRGLEDNLYRNWTQVFTNVEARHGVWLGPRWALQGVAFADAAAFERFDERGGRGPAVAALSGGLGLRLVPTWLASTVLRVDLAYLLAPDQRPFVQLGLKQYVF